MKPLRIGVFGAGRGRTMIQTISQYEGASLVAICDRHEPSLNSCAELARAHGQQVALYSDFEEFFDHEMDAVILANYADQHAPYAVRLLDSGRHVASEVLPCASLAEGVALAEAVERSGKVYAYLENYCYFPATAEMRRLYREGVLGEVKHAEGEYIHDCEPIWPDITYGERDHWRNKMWSTFYCTHSLGPIVHITGLRPVRVSGFESPPSARMLELGANQPESAMEIVTLENGATVKSIHGWLIREPSSIWYSVYGEKAMVESNRWEGGVDTVNLYNPSESHTKKTYSPAPAVQSNLARLTKGHGGSDFYTIHYFIQKILGRPEGGESIDVYRALDMGLPGLLARRSILKGGAPIEIPDFRDAAQRELYRNDHYTWHDEPDPNQDIPDSVYERVRLMWQQRQTQK